MRRRLLGPLGVAGALVAGFGLFAGTAVASPTTPSDDDIAAVDAAADDTATAIAGLEAELATNRAALDAATISAAVATEDYNEAVVTLETAEAEQAAAAAAVTEAQGELDDASAALAALAMASYRSGGDLAQLGALLSADGIEDAIAEATTYQVLGNSSAQAEQRYADAEVAATVADQRSADAVAAAEDAATALEETKTAADAAAAAASALVTANQSRYDELVVELADLRQTSVAMEEQRQADLEAQREAEANEAAAEALGVPEGDRPSSTDDGSTAPAQDPTTTQAPADPDPTTTTSRPTANPTTPAPTTTTPRPTTPAPTTTTPRPTTTTTTPPTTTNPPASDSANAAALAWARTQLGKPYVYGAAGPNSYDCSGLTMRAYQNAGISIPRTSRSQYYAGDLVPVGQMRPGDLFFYSSNGSPSGIYHVAIYAGNGMRLHAPAPGKNVELVAMWWQNVLPYAVRP